MISTAGVTPVRCASAWAARTSRATLHAVDARPLQPEAAAARAEHGVGLLQRQHPLAGRVVGHLVQRRQKLVQRRVEQPDRHGKPRHGLEDLLEVGLLHRQEPVERLDALSLGRCKDHLAHDRQPVLGHEHVLRPAEADALGAVRPGADCVGRRVGVRAHLEHAELVRPFEHLIEVGIGPGLDKVDCAEDHVAGRAIHRDQVPFTQRVLSDQSGARVEIDLQRCAPGNTGLAHAARDHRGVRGHATACRQHTSRVDQSVDVVCSGLRPDEDHVLAFLGALRGQVRVEDRAAGRCARRCSETCCDDGDGDARIDRRVKELFERGRVDALDRLAPIDQALLDERHRTGERRGGRPLASASLQEVEPVVLDRELDILHVSIVVLQLGDGTLELVDRLGERFPHARDRLRRAVAGDDILAPAHRQGTRRRGPGRRLRGSC